MGYAKPEAVKKQRRLVSKSQRVKRKVLVNLFKVLLVSLVALIIACAGAGFGMMKGILDNAPSVDSISIVPKGFRTVLYDKDGNEEMEVATIDSNRVYVYYEDIPEDFVNAVVAIEDQRFWTHNGIDVRGIFRAFIKGATSGNFNEGASTLTQQLIKNQVFNVGLGETTFLDKLERKIQEQYLAIELEKRYSKEELVEYYLNTIYLGRGVSGVQAASQKYFGRDMTELTVSEIAVIAGITQNPSRYDPVSNPEENAKRREDVLDKMLELQYITKQQYDEAMADDVYARIDAEHEEQIANQTVNTYYEDATLDRLNRDFQEIYGCSEAEANSKIFTGGYSVYLVQDKKIQNICENVINDPEYISDTSRVGLNYQLTILDPDKETEHNYMTGHLTNYFAAKTGNSKYNNIYPSEQAAREAADEFKEAMLDKTGGTFVLEAFSVSPQPQFTFVLMDQKTGYVKAMVGGRGPKTANRGFNRATDGRRQPGSTFKVLAAYLPLIDTGMGGLATSFNDKEYTYANGKPVYNADRGHRGLCTVRQGIQSSINVLAVKAITKVTPEVAYDYLIDLGFTTLVDQEVDSEGRITSDKTQSCALGGLTYGVTNLEITAAYASIANMGVYTKPVYYSKVLDHDGNVVIDNTTPTTKRVMKATTAWQLIDAMKSVVTGGTGTPARLQNGMKCAGKTGTASTNYDLWFCGMTPYYTASIWMGYDSNIDQGGLNTHKYMWRSIMEQVVELEGQDTSVDWERPDGITTISVCAISGMLPGEGCPTSADYYAAEDIPGLRCPGHEVLEFCTGSHKLAHEGCPETIELVVDIDDVTGKKTLVTTDREIEVKDYDITTEVCDMHDPNEGKMATLSASCSDGGTISPTVTVEKGSSVTFYITPFDGYRISDVLVNGVSVGSVTSYTFQDVQKDANIKAVFEFVGGQVIVPPVTEAPPPPTEAPPTEAPPVTEAPPPEGGQ